jgi:hypothetical protein
MQMKSHQDNEVIHKVREIGLNLWTKSKVRMKKVHIRKERRRRRRDGSAFLTQISGS